MKNLKHGFLISHTMMKKLLQRYRMIFRSLIEKYATQMLNLNKEEESSSSVSYKLLQL